MIVKIIAWTVCGLILTLGAIRSALFLAYLLNWMQGHSLDVSKAIKYFCESMLGIALFTLIRPLGNFLIEISYILLIALVTLIASFKRKPLESY